MRLLLDFGDGDGTREYTSALVAASRRGDSTSDAAVPWEDFLIERHRGSYAECRGTLDCATHGLPVPVAGCRLLVQNDAGALLFAGYLASAPERLAHLVNAAAPVRFVAVEEASLRNAPPAMELQPAAAVTHAVRLEDHAVRLEARRAQTGDLPADVLVTGEHEAVTYVTELFQGDGTTAVFPLVEPPFSPAVAESALVDDSFAGGSFDPRRWRTVDPGQHLGLGSGGLRLAGGNGFDGQTLLALNDRVELGGTLCAEMRGVLLSPGSEGVLLGMYGNAVTRATCFAGIAVQGSGGAHTLRALVNGGEVGTAFVFAAGHSYTLRLRLHCTETQRVRQSYSALVNGAVQTWGGALVDAPMQLVMEVLDEGLASSTPATVLYAGAVSSSLARAVFAPVNSVSLMGSVARCSLRQQGSAQVSTTRPDGTVPVRRPGAIESGEDYALHGNLLVFFPGRVPEAGEQVCVTYRRGQRAQARLQSAKALAAVQQQGLPGVQTGAYRVTGMAPRSAADCAAAAAALLALRDSPAFGVQGRCRLQGGALPPSGAGEPDTMPGDSVALPLASSAVNVPVERVLLHWEHAVPEVLTRSLFFAQTAENGLSFKLENGAAADARLPATVYRESATASLPQLRVTVAGTVALQVDAGTAAPVGGGFEVRRHDGGWGPDLPGAAPDAELVLRSPVRSFSVPRAAFAERFYVRMYDGSETAVYSAESSLVVTHLPVG